MTADLTAICMVCVPTKSLWPVASRLFRLMSSNANSIDQGFSFYTLLYTMDITLTICEKCSDLSAEAPCRCQVVSQRWHH